MKGTKYLAIGVTIISLMLFYACRKYAKESIQEQTTIEKAMQYYAANKAIPKSETSQTKESLEPNWGTAYETQLADGSKSVIVPTVGFEFKDDSKLSFLRFFAFKEQDGQIIYGRLIEAYGKKEDMPNQKTQIISSFDQDQIKGFEGAILTYDVNYKYIDSRIFKSGIRGEGHARLGKQLEPSKSQLPVTNSVKSKNRIASTIRLLNEEGCTTWSVYLWILWSDGHLVSFLLYSYIDCTPYGGGGSGGSGGGGNTNPGGGGVQYIDAVDPGDAYIANSNSKVSISLAQKLSCFDLVPNTGATYSIKICSDLVNNSSPNALINQNFEHGHAFITLTKTDGTVTVSETFGFYPASGQTALFSIPVSSMIVNDEGHEYNASMQVDITQSQFNTALATAISESSNNFVLSTYNWTDFALAVFNSAVPSADQLVVPDWMPYSKNYFRTPSGLYQALYTRSTTDSRASVSTANAPSSTNCP